jgi:hypothetical protein
MQNRPTCFRACTNRGLGEWKEHKQRCLYLRPEKTSALSSKIAGSLRATNPHPLRWNKNHIFHRNGYYFSDTLTLKDLKAGAQLIKDGFSSNLQLKEQKIPATGNAKNLKLCET